MRTPGHQGKEQRVRNERCDGGAHAPVGRDERDIEHDVERGGYAGNHPVRTCAPRATGADLDDDVAGERSHAKCERGDHVRRRIERLRRDQPQDPRREQTEAE